MALASYQVVCSRDHGGVLSTAVVDKATRLRETSCRVGKFVRSLHIEKVFFFSHFGFLSTLV